MRHLCTVSDSQKSRNTYSNQNSCRPVLLLYHGKVRSLEGFKYTKITWVVRFGETASATALYKYSGINFMSVKNFLKRKITLLQKEKG